MIVAAEDADKAKQAVIFDESGHTWDNPAEDYDSALRTTIEGCREISDEEIEQLGDNPARERLHDFIHSTDTPEDIPRKIARRVAPSTTVEGLAALEPPGHRDRAENLSKNRLAALYATYVGVLSRERGSPMRELNPCACSHQHGLSPLHAEACGGRGVRRGHPAPPDLKGVKNS